ncbi:PD_CobS, cobaltochelatase, CobS subunit [uncultured Caudovirales phage]|uniref:PD_CobS, cobaltochelatase, CobS subunit n=1 Tax=uncultured Caudovirales phage TaxID=2100421 RepID=A0A6J5KSX9_9CAUD|nr:PD_CobS, cobaltochelatase, CobS subunit [uncultured Caudovirales phage]
MSRKSSYATEDMQSSFLTAVQSFYGKDILTVAEIKAYLKTEDLPFPHFILRDEGRKVSYGKYSVSMAGGVRPLKPLTPMAPFLKKVESIPMSEKTIPSKVMSMQADVSCTVPDRDPTYVPFGNYSDIEKIISSKIFFPVYVTGLSGNGKTMSIMQACAKLKRELLRINVTEETDELDLIGGTELVDGSTVNREGAVLLAMRRGSVLLIDEGDLNNTKILCLMPILEGKPYFNKKTGEVISPAEGFNIFITGNTKGKGSEDGRFVGTKVMNEAFLERFSITMEQEYPSPAVEKKIVLKNMELVNCVDDDFATKLTTWSEIIRKSFFEGATDELITTRRLVHIVKTFAIFKDRIKSVNLALNRFDTETKNSFLDLYTKVDTPVVATIISNADLHNEVTVTDDISTGSKYVSSHGRTTEISAIKLLSSKLDLNDIIAETVNSHRMAQAAEAPF